MAMTFEKGNISDDDKYASLVGYERMLMKRYGEKAGRKEILKHRQGIQEERKRKTPIDRHVSIKRKKSDLEIIEKQGIKGKDKIQKAIDQLRQERARTAR